MKRTKTVNLSEEEIKERIKDFIAMRNEQPQDYFPADNDKELPKEGGWIQVILPPATLQYVHYLGVYYAMPVDAGEINMKGVEGIKPYLVKILTETGEVRLFPSEYNRFSNIYQYLEESRNDEVKINWIAPRNENFDTDILHYIMSRGVKRADAYQILLGTITSQNVCYLTFRRDIQEMFAGVGVPNLNARAVILRHIEKKPATKAEVEKAEREAAEYAKKAEAERKEQRRQMREEKKRLKKFNESWFPIF